MSLVVLLVGAILGQRDQALAAVSNGPDGFASGRYPGVLTIAKNGMASPLSKGCDR